MISEEHPGSSRQIVLSCACCRAVMDEWSEPQHWCSVFKYLTHNKAALGDFLLLDTYYPSCSLAYDRLV